MIDLLSLVFTSYISRSRQDCWATTEDLAANFLHPSLFSASLRASPSFRPVHSRMLSSHIFLCLPLFGILNVIIFFCLSTDDMSAQLSQTTLGSSVSLAPTTPDDVFSPPRAPLPEELFTRDNQSQTNGYGQARHASDRGGMGQKQTATISPLQRHSSAPPPQMGIGRGGRVQKQPVGMGRGQPLRHMDPGMSAQYHQKHGLSLNPDTPAFVPSPIRDGSSNLAPPVNPLGPGSIHL